MRVLQVIHGYPPRYNAGSEVYTQTLCHALADRHEVLVFTREENPYGEDYAVREEVDRDDPRVLLHVVNMPRTRDRYQHVEVDKIFARLLDRWQPDVVHIGHLNHVSTSLVSEADRRAIPIIYTLHDYWLMCPRGQFMQFDPENPKDVWAACDGQDDRKCAERCYSRIFSGSPNDWQRDVDYWTSWVGGRMTRMRELVDRVDRFIAPSQYLLNRYRDEFHIPATKLTYLDYGFDTARLTNRRRAPGEAFTFGYIGRHVPAKGIHLLVEAFGQTVGDARLRIWGRLDGQNTEALKAIAGRLPAGRRDLIEWLPEYRNQEIVADVFNRVDCIVVPSIWVENSPLVIHEAQQARIPVITADVGGMSEYVRHEVNGLLFSHRNGSALTVQMQRFLDNPDWARSLGERGYLFAENGNVVDVRDHATAVESIYEETVARKNQLRVAPEKRGPWRITFDTNPDDCNLHCVMCEEHSPFSTRQDERRASGQAKRHMPIDLIRRVVTDAVPHGLRELIPSTMGEPLLYENFEDIIALCHQYHLKLNLTTNGTFPRLGAKRWAERILPVGSDVKISFNGTSPDVQEQIMVGIQQPRMLRNIREFISVRDERFVSGQNYCSVTLQMTFLESNVSELPDIVRLAAELGVDRIKGHHVWAHFRELQDLSMRRNQESITRWNRIVEEAHQATVQKKRNDGRMVKLENIFPLAITGTDDLAPGGSCPFLGKEAWVSAEGRFDPCCAPDKLRRTLGEFGNLNSSGLMEIWGGLAYRDLRTGYANRALCIGCNMRKPKGA